MSSPHYKGSGQPDADQYIKNEDGNVTLNAPALDITWGGDSRYWQISKAKREAELVQVSWLEVKRSIDMNMLKAETKYKLEFTVKMKADAFGWSGTPVYVMARPGKNSKNLWKKVDLSQISDGKETTIPSTSALEFTTPDSTSNDQLSFGLYEIWRGRWKGGLVIKEVKISRV